MYLNLTVQQMIERGGFSDFVIYAGGSGLATRKVRTVCVVDAIDIEGWLFGGEFLLSSGYIFRKDPDRLADLIEISNRGGAAALGVKIGRYIDRMPQEALRAADRLEFPLIGIPFHYAHTDIINPAIIAIADQKSEMMEKSDELRKLFFDKLMGSDPLDSILSLLRESVRRDIIFLNASTGERRVLSDSPEFGLIAGDVPLAFLMDHFPYTAISAGPQLSTGPSKPCGYIFIDRPLADDSAAATMEHAANALRLHLKWEGERWRIERGKGAQFVQDILYKRFKQASEIRNRGLSIGWNLEGRHAVALIGVDSARSLHQTPEEPHISAFEIFRALTLGIQPYVIPYSQLEDGMALIFKAPGAEWAKIKSALEEKFTAARRMARGKTGLHLVMGVGVPVDDLMACDKSFREARRIVAMAKASDNPAFPCFWEDMGVYRLLAPIHDTQDARDFIAEQLGALMSQGDADGPGDSLLKTLFCVIRNNWQLKPVASAMNLHYNTVKYRYRRIGEILSIDLESQSNRLSLALAMELHALNKANVRNGA